MSPERILLIRLSHLGDVVQALPLYHGMRERFPNARLAWAIQPEFAGLVEGLPGLERVIRFGRREGFGAWRRIRRELRDFAPDLAIDAQANAKSAAVLRLSGAARRVGPHRSDWRERWAARARTEGPTTPAKGPHDAERVESLLEHLLGPSAPVPAQPTRGTPGPRRDPACTPSELECGRTQVAEQLGLGAAASRAVIVHVGDRRDPRSWPEEHIVELAAALESAGRRCLLISGPAERDAGERLRERIGNGAKHWIGQCGLRELAGFLTAAADLGARFVGSDSGPTHLAAACGMSVVLLEGPQSHRRTGPWPIPSPGTPDPRHRIVRADPPPPCAPCLSRRCHHPRGVVCMDGLGVEGVLAAL